MEMPPPPDFLARHVSYCVRMAQGTIATTLGCLEEGKGVLTCMGRRKQPF